MAEPLTFDAADFTLDVRLKLLDGTTRDVAIDVFSFNDEFVRMGMDAAINELPPTEFFAKHQAIVCGFLAVTVGPTTVFRTDDGHKVAVPLVVAILLGNHLAMYAAFGLLFVVAGQARPRLLQVSRGLSYAWASARPVGQRIVPGSLQLHGSPIAPEQRLRVTVNAFLASGGDNFKSLAENGSGAHTGMMDIDALEQFFRRAGTVSPATTARIRRLN